MELFPIGVKYAGKGKCPPLRAQILLSYVECVVEDWEAGMRMGDQAKYPVTEEEFAIYDRNNGFVPLPEKQIKEELGYDHSKQGRCFRELTKRGYVMCRVFGIPGKRWVRVLKSSDQLAMDAEAESNAKKPRKKKS